MVCHLLKKKLTPTVEHVLAAHFLRQTLHISNKWEANQMVVFLDLKLRDRCFREPERAPLIVIIARSGAQYSATEGDKDEIRHWLPKMAQTCSAQLSWFLLPLLFCCCLFFIFNNHLETVSTH